MAKFLTVWFACIVAAIVLISLGFLVSLLTGAPGVIIFVGFLVLDSFRWARTNIQRA